MSEPYKIVDLSEYSKGGLFPIGFLRSRENEASMGITNVRLAAVVTGHLQRHLLIELNGAMEYNKMQDQRKRKTKPVVRAVIYDEFDRPVAIEDDIEVKGGAGSTRLIFQTLFTTVPLVRISTISIDFS